MIEKYSSLGACVSDADDEYTLLFDPVIVTTEEEVAHRLGLFWDSGDDRHFTDIHRQAELVSVFCIDVLATAKGPALIGCCVAGAVLTVMNLRLEIDSHPAVFQPLRPHSEDAPNTLVFVPLGIASLQYDQLAGLAFLTRLDFRIDPRRQDFAASDEWH